MTTHDNDLRHSINLETTCHLCVDMQRMFLTTPHGRPWMEWVLPAVEELVARGPVKTCSTRFIPARKAGDGEGSWRGYYRRWAEMTIDRLGEEKI